MRLPFLLALASGLATPTSAADRPLLSRRRRLYEAQDFHHHRGTEGEQVTCDEAHGAIRRGSGCWVHFVERHPVKGQGGVYSNPIVSATT